MEFLRQEYWSGLPFPSPGNLPNPGLEPGSPALQAESSSSEPPGKPFISEVKKLGGTLLLHSPNKSLSAWGTQKGSLFPIPSGSYAFSMAWKIIVFQAFHDFCARTHNTTSTLVGTPSAQRHPVYSEVLDALQAVRTLSTLRAPTYVRQTQHKSSATVLNLAQPLVTTARGQQMKSRSRIWG